MLDEKKRYLKLDKDHAQSKIVYERKEKTYMRKNGEVVQRHFKPYTATQAKISDTIMEQFQIGTSSIYRYDDIKKVVFEQIGEKMERRGLLPHQIERVKDERQRKTLRRQASAVVRHFMDEEIARRTTGEPYVELTYDKLIELSEISGTRFKDTIESIIGVETRVSRKQKVDVIDPETLEIVSTRMDHIPMISKVSFVIDEKIGEHFGDIEEFLKAKTHPVTGKALRNKKAYVKKIQFHLNMQAIPMIVAQGSSYVKLYLTARNKFTTAMAHDLETFIVSIQSAQHNRTLTDHTLEELSDHFGYAFGRTANFLHSTLLPAIEDINKNSFKKVTLLYKFKGRTGWHGESSRKKGLTIEKVRFRITGYEKLLRDNYSDAVFYIAKQCSRINEERSLQEYAQLLKSNIKTELGRTIVVCGKSIANWMEEAKEEMRCERELLKMLSVIDDEYGVMYDPDELRILQDDDALSERIDTPSKSLKYVKERFLGEDNIDEVKKSIEQIPETDKIEQAQKAALHAFAILSEAVPVLNEEKASWLALLSNIDEDAERLIETCYYLVTPDGLKYSLMHAQKPERFESKYKEFVGKMQAEKSFTSKKENGETPQIAKIGGLFNLLDALEES